MAKVHICLDVISHVAKLPKVVSFLPRSLLTLEMIFKHDLESKIARFADSECFTVACGFQRSERRADVRVQASVSTSYEDRIVVSRHKERLGSL